MPLMAGNPELYRFERTGLTVARRRRILLVAAAVALGLAALLWWISTQDDRRLDRHVRQALDRYEQAYARDGAAASPELLRRDGLGPVLGAPGVEKVAVGRDGRTLTAEFIGGRTTGPCGSGYSARAVESAHAVLVVIEEHPNAWGAVCTAEGYRRQVTVRLARPLAGRAVLEAVGGTPVPVESPR